MGTGYGTFVKMEEAIIRENTIINIGDSYLVFSFCVPLELSMNNNSIENQTEEELYLKIYNLEKEYKPIIFKNLENEFFTLGRSDKCYVVIHDKMLSRIHCLISWVDGNWVIRDGNEKGEQSTNGTWIFACQEVEITNNMIFKSNSCNFTCKIKNNK